MTSLSLAALLAWRNGGGPWRSIAALLALMALDIVTGASWSLHDAIRGAFRRTGLYGERTIVQVAAMLAAGATGIAIALLLSKRHRGPALHATVAASALAALFAIAPISLHAVDAVLGRPVGPVMAISLLWAAGAAWIGGAAVAERRRRERGQVRRVKRS